MSARNLYKLVADSHSKGKETELDEREYKLIGRLSRYSHIDGVDAKTDAYTDDKHKDEEGCSASWVEATLIANVFYRKLKSRFIAEYRFVLCAVIFKGSANILQEADERHINDENDYLQESCKDGAPYRRVRREVGKPTADKVVKEDEEPGATAETPETGAEGDGEEQEIFTIQVTKEELEAIKSILDKVEYEDDGSADAEAAAAVVSAMDNENIYGPADE